MPIGEWTSLLEFTAVQTVRALVSADPLEIHRLSLQPAFAASVSAVFFAIVCDWLCAEWISLSRIME